MLSAMKFTEGLFEREEEENLIMRHERKLLILIYYEYTTKYSAAVLLVSAFNFPWNENVNMKVILCPIAVHCCFKCIDNSLSTAT